MIREGGREGGREEGEGRGGRVGERGGGKEERGKTYSYEYTHLIACYPYKFLINNVHPIMAPKSKYCLQKSQINDNPTAL